MKKLLFFHAPWCPPCRLYEREIIEPLAKMVGAERIIRIDVQNAPITAEKYGINKIPAILILNENKRILHSRGGHTTEELIKLLSD